MQDSAFVHPYAPKGGAPQRSLSQGSFSARGCTFSCGLFAEQHLYAVWPEVCPHATWSSGVELLSAIKLSGQRQLERCCLLPASVHVSLDLCTQDVHEAKNSWLIWVFLVRAGADISQHMRQPVSEWV